MKKIFLLLICLLTIGSFVFSNYLIVYASNDVTDSDLGSTEPFYSYSYGGMTYTSDISLDDAWNKAMKTQYKLENLSLDDIEIEYGLYNSSTINHIVPNENSRSSSRNPEEDGVKVHLEWQPSSNGNYIPLKYMKVQLYYIYYNNDSLLTSIMLEEGYTDDNGDYVFTDTLSWKELLHPVSGIIDMFNGIELRVRVCPESETFKIQKDWLNILDLAGEVLLDWSIVDGIIEEFLSYSVITNSINVGYFNRNGDFGTIQIPYGIELNASGGLAESNVLNRSFKVAQSLAMGQKFIKEQGINITNKVNVAYPAFYGSDMDNSAFCYYDYELQSGLMCIGGLQDEWKVMLHEYGHFVHASLGLFPFSWADYAVYALGSIFGVDCGVNPVHLNYIDHISDPNYGKGKNIGTKFAWSEGWADAFSYIVQDYYWNDYYLPGTNLNTVGLEGVQSLNTTIFKSKEECCEGQEDAITIFLNNLYNLQTDGLEMFLSSIKPGYINEEKIQTISMFVDYLLVNYPTYHEDVGKILSNCHISSRLSPISSFDTYKPPVISWIINGSKYTPLNQFEIKFYDVNGNEKYNINNIISTKAYDDIFQYKISNSEWNDILTILGNSSEFGIEIYCYNTTDMLTGPYPSNRVIYDTPYFFDFMLDETTNTYLINGITNVQNDDSVIIPNYYNSKKITKINDSAFLNCTQLCVIELPLYLEEINSSAFKGCSSLVSIIIPSSVQYIKSEAFENCSSLNNVIVLREIADITHLGENVFNGCSSSLKINVPQNRLAEYKNKSYWSSYKSKIIPNSNSFEEYELDCYRTFDIEFTLNSKYNKLYKLNVNCAKNYKITSTANSFVEMKIYDSNMNLVISSNNIILHYLSKGIYYFDLRFVDDEDSGLITTTFDLTWPVSKYDISMGNTNILTHLHKNTSGNFTNKLYLQSVNGEGFYKFTITGYDKNHNLIILPSNAIKIYRSDVPDEIINCYSMIDNSIYAQNAENMNSLIVYLYNYLGFYIDICLPTNEYNTLTLNIQKVTENNVDLFELYDDQTQDVVDFSGISSGDNLQKMVLKQAGRFELNTIDFSQGQFVVLKVRAIVDGLMVFAEPILYDLALNNHYEFDLLEGIYYVGYIGADLNLNLACVLARKVTACGDSYLEPDSSLIVLNGSEVTLNGGIQYSNEITQGFTRMIYLTTGESRLDYYWYSSDETIARVTDYGTVIGLNVNNDTVVKIMAVNIKDPSKVFAKEFIIKKDTKTYISDPIERYTEIVIDMSVSNEVQIDLSNLNVPIDWLQYFTWNSSNSDLYVDQFGRIFADKKTKGNTYTITGTYKLNPRVKVYITVKVE